MSIQNKNIQDLWKVQENYKLVDDNGQCQATIVLIFFNLKLPTHSVRLITSMDYCDMPFLIHLSMLLPHDIVITLARTLIF
jgi:hypothetical protein